MTSSKYRTSFALDGRTIERLRRLSARWKVSQAEVVRRAVEIAERQDRDAASEVREQLQSYRASGKLNPQEADAYLEEVREDRRQWRSSS
jgi:Arc/MetJ-type ribon-helix-helix transcriptional regulator